MSFLSRLRTGQSGPQGSEQGQHNAEAGQDVVEGLNEAEVARAEELHSLLAADPNDEETFAELAELVRRNASARIMADPLRAGHETADVERDANLAVWSLAEELASQPKAWYPLLELARLSLPDDVEGATRRLTTGVERETSGRALTEAVRVLRDSGHPDAAYNFGVAHWNGAAHGFSSGRQLVLAAMAAGRTLDAKRLLRDLEELGQHPEEIEMLRNQVQAEDASS